MLVKKKTCFIVILTLFLASCSLFRHPEGPGKEKIPLGSKLAVFGFEPALLNGQQSKAMRDPITGSVFMAEPVSKVVAQELTIKLYYLVSQRGGYSLIPPMEVNNSRFRVEHSTSDLSERPLDFCVRAGKALGADVVVLGYLYRWRERKGEPYGVRQAASVAFSLSLVSVRERRVLWSGRYDKTQRSLTENLLDLITFLRGKGKWMSAEELGLVGLKRTVKEMPLPQVE